MKIEIDNNKIVIPDGCSVRQEGNVIYFEPKEEKEGSKFEYGQMVLVRHDDTNIWLPALFLGECKEYGDYRYRMFGGNIYKQCIPYEGNEHLRGTSYNKEGQK